MIQQVLHHQGMPFLHQPPLSLLAPGWVRVRARKRRILSKRVMRRDTKAWGAVRRDAKARDTKAWGAGRRLHEREHDEHDGMRYWESYHVFP